MKKAEAISILATLVRPREAKDRARYDEAVKMAIEALKCSETPKSSERAVEATQADHTAESGKKVSIPCGQENDLISRRAAIDAIMGQPPEPHYPSWYAAQIKKLPAAQPEQHKGHWIGGDGSYICSECNSSPMDFIETMGSSFDAYVETLMNFCPNCGAKMFLG